MREANSRVSATREAPRYQVRCINAQQQVVNRIPRKTAIRHADLNFSTGKF